MNKADKMFEEPEYTKANRTFTKRKFVCEYFKESYDVLGVNADKYERGERNECSNTSR